MSQKGFTLIEIIAVLIIISMMAIYLIPRYINLDGTASLKALNIGVETLNKLEKFQWSEYKLSSERYADLEVDIIISARVDTDIGSKYKWSGETLSFGSALVKLERIPATNTKPGIWGGTDSKGNKYGWHKNKNNPHNN